MNYVYNKICSLRNLLFFLRFPVLSSYIFAYVPLFVWIASSFSLDFRFHRLARSCLTGTGFGFGCWCKFHPVPVVGVAGCHLQRSLSRSKFLWAWISILDKTQNSKFSSVIMFTSNQQVLGTNYKFSRNFTRYPYFCNFDVLIVYVHLNGK